MRFARPAAVAVALSFVALTACGDATPVSPVSAVATLAFAQAADHVVISEFRVRGPNGAADEFVELHNPTASPVDITGWKLKGSNASGAVSVRATVPFGVIMPSGGFYLFFNSSSSGGPYSGAVAGNTSFLTGITDDGGIAITLATDQIVDAVGMSAGSAYKEGTPLPSLGTSNLNRSYARNAGPDGCPSQDTNDNISDFVVLSPSNPQNSSTTACGAPPPPPPVVASVTVTPTSATVTQDNTQQFTAAAFDASSNPIAGVLFTWSTTNTNATVSTSGLATAVTPGDVDIVATAPNAVAGSATLHITAPPPPPPPSDVVISQVFGAGGNAGATLTNDYIELFNRGDTPAPMTGWSVQYISANGTGTWAVTPLTGTIPPHSYFLVQETAGNGGTVPLPTPDVAGTIAMGGSAGKVALSNATTALNGACPSGSAVVDRVAYGTGNDTDGCGATWGRTDDISVTLAAFRLMDGCFNSGKSSFDFLVQAPAPRNSASPTHTCPAPSTATIVVNEIMADPLHAAGGSSWGEWFEVKNTGSAPVDLMGWTIATQGQPSHVIASSLVVPPGGYTVLGRGADPLQNGGLTIDYNYFVGSSTIFLDSRDFILLTDGAGGLVDIARWTASNAFIIGSTRGLKDASTDNMNVGGTNWGYSTTQFGDGDFGTPGADNAPLADTPSAFPNTVSFTGRFPTDPPLPIGFEDQLFATENVGTGGTLVTTWTWTELTPTIASIDANGVMRSLSPGSATFRATAADGTTGTFTLPMAVATLGGSAQYGNNIEFGMPTDATAADDFIILRDQFAASYSNVRNSPNWVAYNLEATHIGSAVDRCDCFTHDPMLPASYLHINTNDYTGSGAFAGFGIDRGHLARSFDRTSGALDNAYTYLFSNIIPQTADLNQGRWALIENYLGDLARFSNKEVYIVAGVAGNKGTLKGEGKVVIPEYVWKVAVIMPRNQGLADVHTYLDVEILAIIAPNEPMPRDTAWGQFKTTVDAVEALSGYDLLALLPDKIETIVESGIKPPLAILDGPYASFEGGSVSMSAAASFDPNGTVVNYAWDFGDGTTGSGANVTHTYAQDGSYTVTLVVTDNDGLTDTNSTTASIANVAPFVSNFAGASLLPNETYSASGTFSDPGADVFTATVDYGDGTGEHPLSLGDGTFALSHVYMAAGTFTVTVRVSDDDATSTRTATVTVTSQAQAIQNIAAMVDQLLAGGAINAGNANSLKAKLDAATQRAQSGQNAVAVNQLNALLNEIAAMLRSGRLSPSGAAALSAAVQRVVQSLS